MNVMVGFVTMKGLNPRLLRNSPGSFEGNEFITHCLRSRTEFGLLAFLIAELISGESAVIELLACGHEVEDDASQLVSGRCDGFRRAKFRSHTPVEITERALAVVERLGGHPKGRRGSAVNLPCPDPKHFAAADIVVRT